MKTHTSTEKVPSLQLNSFLFFLFCLLNQPESRKYYARAPGSEPGDLIRQVISPCFPAAEQTSVVTVGAEGAAVVVHFVIGSSNPAVQGPFMNRKLKTKSCLFMSPNTLGDKQWVCLIKGEITCVCPLETRSLFVIYQQ